MDSLLRIISVTLILLCFLILCRQSPCESSTVDPITTRSMSIVEAVATPEPAVIAKQRWLEDFESSRTKLAPINRSRVFRRTREEASSGYFNLVLKAPLKGQETGRFVGGDIAKMVLPPARPDNYKVSIKTYLKQLDRGRLMLRASFFKLEYNANLGPRVIINRIMTVGLKDIEKVEDGWTVHEFTHSLLQDGIDASYMTFYAALDSGDESTPAGGVVYLDDVEFEFFSDKPNLNHYQQNIDKPADPSPDLRSSKIFSRTRDEASSSDTSLQLDSCLPTEVVDTVVGGGIARMSIPPDSEVFTLSMRSWLKGTDSDQYKLQADFFDKEGNRSGELLLAEIAGPENGWTDHHFEHRLEMSDSDATTMTIHAAIDSRSKDPTGTTLYIDDVELRFHGPNPTPLTPIVHGYQIYRQFNFDTHFYMPESLKRSKVFSRTRGEASSGNYSLMLKTLSADGSTQRIVGGEIARFDIPQNRHNVLFFYVKTWLKELDMGALVLQEVIYDKYGRIIDQIPLGQIHELEQGWTSHRFGGHGGAHPMNYHFAKSVGLYVALESQMSVPVKGTAYLDDVEILIQ